MLLKKSLTGRTTWHDDTGFPMLTMHASFRKWHSHVKYFNPVIQDFFILYFSYKTKLWNNAIFCTVTNKWYLSIDLFRWSYNMYCVYIHAVLNPNIGLNIIHSLTHTYLPWTKNWSLIVLKYYSKFLPMRYIRLFHLQLLVYLVFTKYKICMTLITNFVTVKHQLIPFLPCAHWNNRQTKINKDMASTQKKQQWQAKERQ